MALKNLLPLLHSDFELTKAHFDKQNIDYVYGRKYSVNDLRDFTQDKFPTIIHIKDKPFVVVGENPSGFLLQNQDTNSFFLKDQELKPEFSGEAIIITDDLKNEIESDNEQDEPVDEDFCPVILTPERDTWTLDKQAKKNVLFDFLEKFTTCPAYALPPYRPVLIFKEATEKELQDKIRAYTIGSTITLIDSSDPVTLFLHELGHLFYRTRLTDSECKRLEEIYKSINPKDVKSLPGIFENKWEFNDAEELFCTIYLWYIRALVLNKKYLEILKNEFCVGFEFLHGIFCRIQAEEINNYEWNEKEKDVYNFMKTITGTEKNIGVLSTTGKFLKKAILLKSKTPALPNATFLPSDLPVTFIKSMYQKTFLQVNEGLCKGEIFVLDNKTGKIDFNFMQLNPEKLLLQKARGGEIETSPLYYATQFQGKTILLQKAKNQDLFLPVISNGQTIWRQYSQDVAGCALDELTALAKGYEMTANHGDLVRKEITNKLGHKQTVFVKSGEKKLDFNVAKLSDKELFHLINTRDEYIDKNPSIKPILKEAVEEYRKRRKTKK